MSHSLRFFQNFPTKLRCWAQGGVQQGHTQSHSPSVSSCELLVPSQEPGPEPALLSVEKGKIGPPPTPALPCQSGLVSFLCARTLASP